jgi:serine protease AprX
LKDAAGHNRIVYKQSFVPGDTNTGDKFGHGDHVAGIVGGNGKKSTGNSYDYKIRGIAPNVSLVDLRVLNNTGAATDSTVIAAIQKAIDLKSTYNIRVINLSLGRTYTTSYTSDPLCQAVQQAWAAGIVVVVAAGNLGRDNSYGNNGYGTITAPANRPYLITVGAMNTMLTLSRSDDIVASYSSKGPTQIDHFIVSVRPSAG